MTLVGVLDIGDPGGLIEEDPEELDSRLPTEESQPLVDGDAVDDRFDNLFKQL